ncbi:MAG: putative dihydrolipoamide acetyltransferase [Thermoleophilia bacterium]|nr:putative dihydrolipoamide acetyltransferase [Thermoleophilia bacterium]
MATGTIVDVVMPQMGVSVSEGTISTWLKAVGDTIEKDETLLEISTDKVDTEVPSPVTGIVTALLVEEGETVDVGVKLAEIEVGGEGGAAPAAAAPAPAAPELREEVPAAPAPTETVAPAAPAPVAPAAAPAAAPASGSVPGRFVSPVVASIADEQGIDPSLVPGTGSGGRVTKKDILAYLDGGAPAAAPAAPAAPAAAAPAPVATPAAAPASAVAAPAAPAPQPFVGGETVVPFNPMRKAIARHMVESVHTSPHVTSTMEVDMTRVVNLRNRVKNDMQQQWGVKVTFTHFVIRALIDAIAHFPLINSEIRGESAVVKSYVNLGIAVALDEGQGLIVPVLQHAEEKNLVGIARGVNDIATRARTKKLRPDDVSGGTFTLTNPGIFGAIHGTPIINQPQVAIIDTEAIVKRPVVVTDADGADSIAIRSMMNLCLSYDHRIIDGAYAVQFLAHLRRSLETWDEAAFIG